MKKLLLVLLGFALSFSASAQTWTELNTSFGESLQAVFVTPQGKVMVAGTGGLFASSTDGGETWSEIDATDGEDIEAIHFLNENDGLVLIKDLIYLSDDGGASFPFMATVTGEFLDFTFSDATHGWAVGKEGDINYTTDAGQTWNVQQSGTQEDLEAVSFADNSHGIAVGTNSVARITSNGGTNWSNAGVNGNEDFAAAAFVDANNAWIAGGNAEIFSTANAGSSWTMQFSPVEEDFLCMSFVDASNGFIAGDNGTIISTTNGGATWNENNTGVTKRINDIFMVTAEYGFAVGDNGLVLRLGDVATAITEVKSNKGISISPNPAHDMATIRFAEKQAARIELTDASGMIIQSFTPVNGHTQISLASLPQGVYFVKAIDKDGTKTVSRLIKQ